MPHTSFEVVDGNLVVTKTETPTDLTIRHATGIAGAVFSFALSRKLTGFPKGLLIAGALLRVFFTGVGVGATAIKYMEAAATK